MNEEAVDLTRALSREPKRKSGFLFFFIIGIIFFIVGFGFFSAKQSSLDLKPKISPVSTSSALQNEFPTEIPVSPLPVVSEQAKSLSKETIPDKSDLTIDIQNGSGVKLAASKVSIILKSLGYHVISLGNAEKFDYEGVTIRVKEEKSGYLPLLKKDLLENYEIASFSADLSASSAADALVIVGK